MAKAGSLKVKFETKSNIFKELQKSLKDLFSRKARENFADLRPFIEEGIGKGIAESKDNFQASDAEAAELGIGDGGSVDREKTRNAWQILLPFKGNDITTFTVRKVSGITNLIGTVTIEINRDKFFDSPECNVDTPDSEGLPSIPWMRWMIEGKVIFHHRFTDKISKNVVSRTGKGMMIKGGLWTFPPRPTAFEELEDNIKFYTEAAILKDIGKVINA